MSVESERMTEIGEIPERWKMVRLGDDAITEIRGNKTINKFERVAFIPMDFVSDSGIFVRYEMRSKNDVKSFTYCEPGDLLLAKITPSLENGKQGIIPASIPNGFALATTEVFPISCKGIDRLFLFYVLKLPKFRNKIISSMIGTTGRQRASKESVENLQIPLPPLPEQRRIAEVLGTVDSAIQKVGGAIKKTERLKKGLMQRLLMRGIGHERLKDSKVGRVPEGWDVIKLGDVSKINYGLGQPPPTKNDGVPMIRATNIDSGKILEKDVLKIDIKKIPITREVFLKEGDIIVVRSGAYTGDVGLVSKKWEGSVAGYDLIVSSNRDKVEPRFLSNYLLSPQIQKMCFMGLKTRSAQPHLNSNQLENISVALPPLPEQRRIAEILSAVDRKLELERRRKEKLERVKKGLMNELLTGRKRMKVEVL